MSLVGHQVGPYRVLALIGRGGTAEVYKAFHPALERQVAIKLLLREASNDADWVRRFRQEALLLGYLDHPHILPIYDAGEHEGRPYLVMKYVMDGVTLRSRLDGRPWPLDRAAKVLAQVAEALHAAHQAGVVHRDVKPSNILITSELRSLVFDFGIAKPFRRDNTSTSEGLIVGTPEFMSPEQCKGEKVDHRSDIYALGVLAYQMLVGRVPFTADTAVGIMMKHLTEPLPIPPPGIHLPGEVNQVLARALARAPEERFASAQEFGQALRTFVDDVPTLTLQLPPPRAPRRRRWWMDALADTSPRRVIGSVAATGLLGGVFLGYLLSAPVELPAPQFPPKTVPEPPLLTIEALPGEARERAASPRAEAKEDEAPLVKLEPGRLEIVSDVPVTVWLDGQRIGTGPRTFPSLPPGRHVVRLEAADGRSREEDVLISAGSTAYLRAEFSPAPVRRPPVESLPDADHGWSRAGLAPEPPRVETEGAAMHASGMGELRQWEGFLTDEDCREKGGLAGADHARCAERCIRLGKRPMLYTRGRLYYIDGFERIAVKKGEPLAFSGWLDERTRTIHVSGDP